MAGGLRTGVMLACALTTFVFLSQRAVAEQDALAWRDAKSINALRIHLEEWLDRNTDLSRSQNIPKIQHISVAQAAQMHTPLHSSQLGKTRGLYDPETHTIYLVRPWDKHNPYDVAVLLHELVHHRQKGHGHWYCAGAQELPAYRIQEQWLAELTLKANINWIAVFLEAGCTPRDFHPD